MSEKKPTPWIVPARGKICPVCGKPAYSLGGIHPQCAVQQADAARAANLKAERKLESNTVKQSTWAKKKCPKCHKETQARRKVCDCGYVFS